MLRQSTLNPALLGLLILCASCGGPTSPAALPPPGVANPAPPTPAPSRVYGFVRTAHPTPQEWELVMLEGSRYTLNADGTFVLELINGIRSGFYAMRGRYTEAEGRITFDFDWNNLKAGATAVFAGEEMTVKYDVYMSEEAGFPDAVYLRRP